MEDVHVQFIWRPYLKTSSLSLKTKKKPNPTIPRGKGHCEVGRINADLVFVGRMVSGLACSAKVSNVGLVST